MPFDKGELIRQSGADNGDILPLQTFTAISLRTRTTTSTTFTGIPNLFQGRLFLDELPPDGPNIRVRMTGVVNPGTGETAAVRYRNDDDNRTLVDVTGITSLADIDSGWVPYDPTGDTPTPKILFQHKTDPGSNSSTSRDMILYVGVQL